MKVKLENINISYGDKEIYKDFSLEITSNKITGILGRSGCGKTTLLNYIISKIMNFEDISYVFQNDILIEWMSVYDNITYGPRTHGIRSKSKLDDIVEKSLRDAAIWDEVKDRLKKSALGMSGGQQQRLCIARALAVQPEVLLMDEPTSALDPISTSKIEELAMELKKDYTIVMVTHNMQQATRISDKTAFFLLGEVVEFDDTDKLFSMPSDKRTEDYITGRFG